MKLNDPVKILIVDDTNAVTKLLSEQISNKYKKNIVCLTASSGEEALDILNEEENIDILVSDLEMPGMGGLELLRIAYEKFSDMFRILLSGFADMDNITHALNDCGISSFISKPWNPPQLFIIIDSALNDVRLQRENKFLNESLNESFYDLLNLLSDIISEVSSELYEYSKNVASLAVKVGNELKLSENMKQDLEIAGLLHAIGLLGMPTDIYKIHPKQLGGELRAMYLKYPEISVEMLKSNPRIENSREIIRVHLENVDGSGPLQLKGKSLPITARILRICSMYSSSVLLRDEKKDRTIQQMNRRAGTWFDKRALAAFVNIISLEIGTIKIPVTLDDLRPGMKVGQDVYSKSGRMVMANGALLTALNLKRLRVYNEMDTIEEVFIEVKH